MKILNRSPAFKLWIADVLAAEYKEGDEETLAGLKINNNIASRVNLMGVVISKNQQGQIQTIEIEDGTGKMQAKTFDTKQLSTDVGDCIFLIGKPKVFNGQKYVVMEIAKKIERPEWIEVRKRELPRILAAREEPSPKVEIIKEEKQNDAEKIITLIRQKDSGNGADYEEVLNESGLGNAEEILKNLTQIGVIFHIAPTKIKILE